MSAAPEIVLRDPKLKANPYPLFARLRREAPVCRARGVTRMLWLVTRHEDVQFVLKDNRFANNRANAPLGRRTLLDRIVFGIYGPLFKNMATRDEPDHGRLRRLVQQAFTNRRIEELRGRIEELTNEYLDRVASRPQWDVVADYALPLPVTIIAEMLGVPPADRARFHRFSDTLVRSFGASLPYMVRKAPSMSAFVRYVRSLVRLRRKKPQDDLIGGLVTAHEDGQQLSEEELVSTVLLLLVAGHETTVNLISNGTLALLEYPVEMQKLRANPGLMPRAVEEFARYYSPIDYAQGRYTREPVTIAGVEIPAGEVALACISSANRDESVFDHAGSVDIARDPNPHVGFGHGIHYCLGVFLARLESQIAFTTLLHRCPELRLAAPRESLRWRPSFLLRGLEALPVAGAVVRPAVSVAAGRAQPSSSPAVRA